MSTISARQPVKAPLASAARLLHAYLESKPAHAAGGVRITLSAHNLEKLAVVTLMPAHRPQDMTPRYTVHWEAEDDGPYPVFDGILTVEAYDDYDTFRLALKGTYEPPLGVAGKAFDAVIGNRIAERTAHELLTEIGTAIEAQFTGEEIAKRH